MRYAAFRPGVEPLRQGQGLLMVILPLPLPLSILCDLSIYDLGALACALAAVAVFLYALFRRPAPPRSRSRLSRLLDDDR